ncbi:hypothetical protein BN863_27270 [Formosa agariphila KMM 3901]|uniref:Uncharacterized protein n=1 Tax=Formosa agariphila (strain DSM 15362 / KCTC 12365 / LMG 23005 / KMM 3901 / M-2Alg 35-1) TaxID=1347342 RepID=T2KR23_FORAG|nr:hypothetical protein [Formosa agariphila]CDF80439.1 hypothetical protein BN863_27270 [Formosa agariphila KMM 3901]
MKPTQLIIGGKIKAVNYSFLDKPIFTAEVDSYSLPYPVEPTKGKHILENCNDCRNNRLILIDEINSKFKDFPNCCELHKNLNDKNFFNKNDYVGIAEMIADKVLFTYQHIINNIDNDDWYDEIISYFNYNIDSFGKLPIDCGEPFQLGNYHYYLLNLLKNIENEIKSDKISPVEVRTRINKVRGLIDIENEPLEESNKTDLNLLLSTYDNWFKSFPFDLPYFKHLEIKFKRVIPIFTGKKRFNKYLKKTQLEPHTKESLSVTLLQTTHNILKSVNGATLYDKGLLNNTEKIAVDLIVENRKLELLEFSSLPNKQKADYVKALKKWFKQEKKFIKEITPFVQKLPRTEMTSKNELTKEALFEMQNKLTTKILISEVFNHFDILTKTTNKNNEFYLTNEQLLIFIKSTFVDLEPHKQDFNCKYFIKKNIRKVFFNFYVNNKNRETNLTNIKRKYFNIMNNAFNGFNENDYTDFAK